MRLFHEVAFYNTYIDVCVGMCTYMYMYVNYPVFHALISPSDIFSVRLMWQTLTLLTAELIRTRPYPKERYPLHIYMSHIATGPVSSTPRYCTGYIHPSPLTPLCTPLSGGWATLPRTVSDIGTHQNKTRTWDLGDVHGRCTLHMQRNFSNAGTVWAEESVLVCEVSWTQGL